MKNSRIIMAIKGELSQGAADKIGFIIGFSVLVLCGCIGAALIITAL